MGKPIRTLLVDDEEGFRETVTERLTMRGHQVTAVPSAETALSAVKEQEFDVAVVDILMPGMDGITLLEHLRNLFPFLEVIILTGQGSIESAVDAMRKGAYHYLTKPLRLAELELHIRKAQEKGILSRQNTHQQEELKLRRRQRYGELVGQSEAIRTVLNLARRVASSDCTVLIEGETGTGKELLAHLVHREGSRSAKPFIVVNCGALPEDLLERELFGHCKGAFTGASESKPGLIEVADEGTLLLDEIGEMSFSGQIALLRVLESGLLRRLGETREIQVDVRVLAATNRTLSEALQERSFREDLYHRLNVVRLHLPPLQERREDIPLLAHYFLQGFSLRSRFSKSFSDQALEALLAYRWAGNVRELSNVIERACLVCEGKVIGSEHLGLPAPSGKRLPSSGPKTLEEGERHHILQTLGAMGGDKKKTAEALGITPRHLYRKLAKYR